MKHSEGREGRNDPGQFTILLAKEIVRKRKCTGEGEGQGKVRKSRSIF